MGIASGHEIVPVGEPVGGLNKAGTYRGKPPYYFELGLNVRAYDVLENRGRMGSRPGQVKTFAQQLGLTVPVESFTLEITPTKDTYFEAHSSRDEVANGLTTSVGFGSNSSSINDLHSVFHFDVSDIPSGANIISAPYKVYIAGGLLGGAWLAEVYRLKTIAEGGFAESWVESQASWNKYAAGLSWPTPGGDYHLTDPTPIEFIAPTIGGWQTLFDLSSFVDDAKTNRSDQLHFLCKRTTEAFAETQFFLTRSREYDDPGNDFPAPYYSSKLTVAYELGGPAGADNSTEIRLMAICRTLSEPAIATFADLFTANPINATDWPSSGSWVIDGTTTSGKPTILSNQYAASLTAGQLRSALLRDVSPSLTAPREISISPYPMQVGTEINLLMDMDDTTPVPAGSIWLRASWLTGGLWNLRLYHNEVLVGTATTSTPEAGVNSRTIRLTIDSSNVVRAYWVSATSYSIIYSPSGYIAAGGRVGFGLQNDAGGSGVAADSFGFSYSPTSGVDPQRMLMASANGYLYKESTAGEMVLVASDLTLRRDRLLSAINRFEKLFIADYQLIAEDTDGVTSGSGFSSASYADWTALELGSDVIVNGGFAADTDWTKGTGWTIGSGVATATGAINTNLLQEVDPLSVGRTYRVTYTITRTAGIITPAAGTTNGTNRSSSGTFTEDIICAGDGGFKFTTSGFTGTVDNVSAQAITLAVDADDYRLEIISGTGATIGVYGITAVSATTLTLSSAPGNASGISFRIVRGAKVYDAATNALTMLGLGTIGVSQFPVGFRHFSLWADKIVATNDAAKPQQWQMSAQKYPLLWDFGDSGTVGENGLTTDTIKLSLGVGAACSDATAVNSGFLGEPIVCTIPINDTYLIFCCRHSFHVLRGNPKIDGEFITLSRDVGILDIGAHVRTPDGRIIVMTLDGLYEVTFDGVKVMSRDVLPQELTGIDAKRYEVTLGYDFPRRGICIAAVARDLDDDPTLPSIHYFYDVRVGGYFLDEYASDHDPTATVAHQVGGLGEQILLRGCRDGYIRNFSDQAGSDDLTNFNSYLYQGPVPLGTGEYDEGILHEIIDVLDNDSGSVALSVYGGHSPEAALASTPRYTTSMSGGRNRPRWPRLRYGWVYLRTDGTPGTPWAREILTITRERTGKLMT